MTNYYKRFFSAIAVSLIVACMNSAFGCGMLFAVIMFGISRPITAAAQKEMDYISPEGINPDLDTPEHITGVYKSAPALVKYMRENFE